MARSTFGLCVVLLASLAWLALSCSTAARPSPQDPLEHARRLHRLVPLIDGHNDLVWRLNERAGGSLARIDIARPQPELMTDIPRLRRGGVGGQFWSVYVPATMTGPAAVRAVMEAIDTVHRMARRYPEDFSPALSAADVELAFAHGRIACLIGMEGGHSIDNSLAVLRMFHRLGARYMTLTHSLNTAWADSATDQPKSHGLSAFGREVVREMNRLGMLVDLSHVSPEVMAQALEESRAPVIFSHSAARALCDHPRNVPDDILRRLPANGGMVMVCFVPDFISPDVRAHSAQREQEAARLRALYAKDEAAARRALAEWDRANPAPRARLSQVADHIDHIRRLAGIDHIGLGSDFDGISSVIEGLEDVSKYPDLTAELIRRGYSDEDILKILGRNLLRVLSRAEAVARRLQQERGPSEARIEDLDRH
jgi:membrane dipeptidase